MILEQQVIDVIKSKEVEMLERKKDPSMIVLTTAAYAALKEELGYDLMEDISYYKGMEILITMSENENAVRVI